MEKKENVNLGVFYMIMSSLGFSAMAIVIRYSGSHLPIFEQAFVRNFMTSILGYFWVKSEGVKPFGEASNRKHLVLRSVFGLAGIILNFYAIRNLPAADSAVLQKSSPFFIALFAAVFMKDRLSKKGVFAIILAFIGAMFVAKPSFDSSLFPALAALGSAMTAGMAYTIVSYLRGKENPMVIVFFFSAFSTAALFIPMLFDFVAPGKNELIPLLLIGIFATMGQYYVTKSLTVARASAVSIYNYTGVIFSAVLGYFILDDKVDVYSALGILIIFVATVIQLRDSNKKEMKEIQP